MIVESKFMVLLMRIRMMLLLACGFAHAEPCWLEAPNHGAAPVDQLLVGANACGPAAMMNAFHSGGEKWRRVFRVMGGKNDKERMAWMIREVGMRSSNHLFARSRWSKRGVGVEDLRDMGNELLEKAYLPSLEADILFLGRGESVERLLERAHKRMRKSLAAGFPPILSLRRYALKKDAGKKAQWAVIEGHFVTLTRMPCKLQRGGQSYAVDYLDPWRGRRCHGLIEIPKLESIVDSNGAPACLEANFPSAMIGKNRVQRGERTVVAVVAVIGDW